MTPKQLAQLEKLAALKARKRLGALSDIRARRAEHQQQAESSRDDAARAHGETPQSGAELQMLHRLGAASLSRAAAAQARAAALAPQEEAAFAAAAREKGRELALGGMAAKARAEAKKDTQKQADRASDALLSLKRFR